MTEKRLRAKELDYATGMFVNTLEPTIIDVTEQEKQYKQRVIDAVINDCPKNKIGYLVMEIKDKELKE